MGRDEELRAQVAEWAVAHGLADLSLRPLAADLGTSDRMLLYYFGSKDGLVLAIVEELARGLTPAIDAALVNASRRPSSVLQAVWELVADPALRPVALLLFEIDVLAGRRGGPFASAVSAVLDSWRAALADALAARGVPRRAAPGLATAAVDAMVGALLRVAATGAETGHPDVLRVLGQRVDAARPSR